MRLFIASMTALFLCPGLSRGETIDREWLNERAWPAFVHDRQLETEETKDQIHDLQIKRVNACLAELRDRYIYWLQGTGTLKSVCDNADRLIEARIDAGLSPNDEVKFLEERLEFAKRILQQAEAIRANNTTKSAIDKRFARYYRLDTEIAVAMKKQELDAVGSGR